MSCESMRKPRQTITERKAEVIRAVSLLDRALAAGRARVTIGPQGAVAFSAWTEAERDGVTDACAYRRIMASGSMLAKAAIARAEQLSGRVVNRQAVAIGAHSHDGGKSWHDHKG